MDGFWAEEEVAWSHLHFGEKKSPWPLRVFKCEYIFSHSTLLPLFPEKRDLITNLLTCTILPHTSVSYFLQNLIPVKLPHSSDLQILRTSHGKPLCCSPTMELGMRCRVLQALLCSAFMLSTDFHDSTPMRLGCLKDHISFFISSVPMIVLCTYQVLSKYFMSE